MKFVEGSVATMWPWPTDFIEKLMTQSFWTDQITKFKGDTLVPPRILGQRFLNSRNGPTRLGEVSGPHYIQVYHKSMVLAKNIC